MTIYAIRPSRRVLTAGLRAAMLIGWALTLGACTKCDIPTPWEHSSAGSTPAACHDSPQTQ